jgi:transcriptional regulator with XRE-family HTH domain
MGQEKLTGFGQRIKNIRKALRLNQKDFASPLNISSSFLSEIENGKYKPGFDFFKNILDQFNVNLHYLLTGQGEMFNQFEKKPVKEIKNPFTSIESGEELLWYIDRSLLFKHTVLGFATKFLYDNKPHIKSEIEEFETKKNRQCE